MNDLKLSHWRRNLGTAIVVSLALLVALVPARAHAKPIRSAIEVVVFAVIDPQATVVYGFSGQIKVEPLTFACMENRKVLLFHVDGHGHRKQYARTESEFLGSFSGTIDRRLSAISGYYYAKVMPRVRKTRKGRLRCLAARTSTSFVEVPGGLLAPPALGTP